MDDISNARETTSKLPRVETGDIFQQIAIHQKWSFNPKVGRKLSRKCCNISDSVFFFSSKSLLIWGKKKRPITNRKEAGVVLQDLGPASRQYSIPSTGQDCKLAVQQPASLSTTLLQGNSCFKCFIEMNFKEVSILFGIHRHTHTTE